MVAAAPTRRGAERDECAHSKGAVGASTPGEIDHSACFVGSKGFKKHGKQAKTWQSLAKCRTEGLPLRRVLAVEGTSIRRSNHASYRERS